MYFQNGDRYTGQWRGGVRCDDTLTAANGDVYTGNGSITNGFEPSLNVMRGFP